MAAESLFSLEARLALMPSLRLVETARAGRGLACARAFESGDLIFEEEAVAWMPLSSRADFSSASEDAVDAFFAALATHERLPRELDAI